jgi:hypothetical protein
MSSLRLNNIQKTPDVEDVLKSLHVLADFCEDQDNCGICELAAEYPDLCNDFFTKELWVFNKWFNMVAQSK